MAEAKIENAEELIATSSDECSTINGARAVSTGLARAIIDRKRPALSLALDKLPADAQAKMDRSDGLEEGEHALSAEEFETFTRFAEKIAASVGRIEILDEPAEADIALLNNDENALWVPVGTCFRASSKTTRVVTARHLLRAVLMPDKEIMCEATDPPLQRADGQYRRCRVVFEPTSESMGGKPTRIVEVNAIEWAHAHWDMMLLELSDDSEREPLALAMPVADDAVKSINKLYAIGYPMKQVEDVSDDAISKVFSLEALSQKKKHMSYGRIRHSQSLKAGILNHDAPTLGGSSGSPIVCMITGEVVGVHYLGGHLNGESNKAVYLPRALMENALRARLDDDFVAGGGDVPKLWDRALPKRHGQPLPV